MSEHVKHFGGGAVTAGTENGLLAAALDYAGRGWYVFPCHLDKTPATKHGVRDATIDPGASAGGGRTIRRQHRGGLRAGRAGGDRHRRGQGRPRFVAEAQGRPRHRRRDPDQPHGRRRVASSSIARRNASRAGIRPASWGRGWTSAPTAATSSPRPRGTHRAGNTSGTRPGSTSNPILLPDSLPRIVGTPAHLTERASEDARSGRHRHPVRGPFASEDANASHGGARASAPFASEDANASHGGDAAGDADRRRAAAALRDELAALGRASEGERNDSLYRAALRLGRPVADGVLDRTQVEIDLRSVALDDRAERARDRGDDQERAGGRCA